MKEVRVTLNKTVSYLFHLLSVSKIAYDNDYSKKYENSINKSDLEYLKEAKQLLTFGNGNAGILFVPFITVPAYISPCNKTELEKYYKLLSNAIESNDCSFLLEKYKNHFKSFELWNGPFELFEELIKEINRNYKELSIVIANIFINNYDNFNDVWAKESLIMKDKVASLNSQIGKTDFIKKWEEITKSEFKTSNYEIILCSAIEGGPSANSLGYDKNVFYYNANDEDMIEFISHEIGTHILIDLLIPYLQNHSSSDEQLSPAIWYSAYENLAKFYNQILYNKKLYYYVYDNGDKFQSIYNNLYYKDTNISSKDLLNKAISDMNCINSIGC